MFPDAHTWTYVPTQPRKVFFRCAPPSGLWVHSQKSYSDFGFGEVNLKIYICLIYMHVTYHPQRYYSIGRLSIS